MHQFYKNGKLERESKEWYKNGDIGNTFFYNKGILTEHKHYINNKLCTHSFYNKKRNNRAQRMV